MRIHTTSQTNRTNTGPSRPCASLRACHVLGLGGYGGGDGSTFTKSTVKFCWMDGKGDILGVLLHPCAHRAYFWVLFITQIQYG